MSFIGCAPADNPQVVIYVVVDEPNVEDQPHSTFAMGIVRNILTEVLPYLHIPQTEEMTITEQAEIDAALQASVQNTETEKEGAEAGEGEVAEGEGAQDDTAQSAQNEGNEETQQGAIYVVDPNTGELIDSITGIPAEHDYHYEGEIEEMEEDENKPTG